MGVVAGLATRWMGFKLLAIGRGLSQGKRAAIVSGVSSGAGLLFHVAAATFGLTLLMQTLAVAFWVVKLTGAAYLLWLGIKVLRSRNLISFAPAAHQPLSTIFVTDFYQRRSIPSRVCLCWHFFPNLSAQNAVPSPFRCWCMAVGSHC